MNKHERARDLISHFKEKHKAQLCHDEVIQQIIYDLRAYADLYEIDFQELLKKSEIPFKNFGA